MNKGEQEMMMKVKSIYKQKLPKYLRVCIGIALLAIPAAIAIAQGPPKPPGPPGKPGIIYSSIPKPLPGNVGSEGPEAYAFSELGDGVVFPGGAGGTFDHVTVILSSWGCTSGAWNTGDCVTAPKNAQFSQIITLNIYAVNAGSPPSPGALLAKTTQTFQIPYRPSSTPDQCSGDNETWFNPKDKTCYHGIAVPITFDLTHLNVSVPSEVIVTLAFNSTHYGPSPVGESAPCFTSSGGCPYDSLNISTDSGGENDPPANVAFIGSFLVPDSIFVNYTLPGNSCSGTSPVGVLALDQGCWTGFHPEIEIGSSSKPAPPPKPHNPK
jgi:hypothetical protein